jgi:hypothetical protein
MPWIHLTDEEATALSERFAVSEDPNEVALVKAIALFNEGGENRDALIQKARDEYAAGSDDDIEVDEGAALSESDNGTWVMAWVWLVDDETADAGLETPVTANRATAFIEMPDGE